MSDTANHKGQVPRVNGWRGYTFRRSRHLADYSTDKNECLPTYPGPGQRPDSNFFSEGNYDAPKDWPRAGQLLRAPQVAWLSCLTLDDTTVEYVRKLAEKRYETWHLTAGSSEYFTGDYSPVSDVVLVLYSEYGKHTDVWGTGGIDNTGSYFYSFIDGESHTYSTAHDGTDGTGISFVLEELGPVISTVVTSGPVQDGLEGRPWWIDTRIANPMKEIFDRMHHTVFPEVKERIESLRPGRTWVEFHDWVDEYTDPPNEYWVKDGVFFSNTYYPMIVSHMQDFYGTDFLHVYLGVAAKLDGPNFDGDTSEPVYRQGKSYLGLNAPLYAGFRVLMYGLDPEYDAFAEAPPFPFEVGTPVGPNVRRGNGPFYVIPPTGGHYSDPEPFNDTIPLDELWTYYGDSVINFDRSDALATVDDFNEESVEYVADKERFRDEANEAARTMAEDLEEFGFSYEGDGKDLDANTIIGIIAAHYKFDPDSGRDIVG